MLLARRLAGAILGLVPLAALAVVTPASAQEPPAWFWEWSDGSRAQTRTIAESQYRSWTKVPGLEVASSPARPGVPITLEFHDGRSWRTEDAAITDARGRATLRLNPYDTDGDWSEGPERYRIHAGTSTASVAVVYR